MKPCRSDLLNPTLRVSAREVRWFFLNEYYDGPVAGLAIFDGRIHRFCCFQEDVPHQQVYVLQKLTDDEMAEEIRVKSKFERMVGTYGCFDERGELLPSFMADDASKAQFFAEESFGPTPEPYDRPIVAWFDQRES